MLLLTVTMPGHYRRALSATFRTPAMAAGFIRACALAWGVSTLAVDYSVRRV